MFVKDNQTPQPGKIWSFVATHSFCGFTAKVTAFNKRTQLLYINGLIDNGKGSVIKAKNPGQCARVFI